MNRQILLERFERIAQANIVRYFQFGCVCQVFVADGKTLFFIILNN